MLRIVGRLRAFLSGAIAPPPPLGSTRITATGDERVTSTGDTRVIA